MLKFEPIPVLNDNYIWLLTDEGSDAVGVVDPSTADEVMTILQDRGLKLTHILNTHHHWDHIGGNRRLVEEYGCKVIGPKAEIDRIPDMDETVEEGDVVRFGSRRAEVFFVPGHTRGHIAYWFEEDLALFPGDTLFSIGCGRLFEGTPKDMWQSLLKLRALPDETQVCCAHEYTQDNIRFALTIEPDNPALQARAAEVETLRAAGQPTLPSLLGEEKAANPFLRADAPELQAAIDMEGEKPVEVFASIRRRKDRF